MYDYFKELEHPNDFKVSLSRGILDRKRHHYINNPEVPSDFYIRHSDLFKRLNYLDSLIIDTNSQSIEEYMKNTGEFLISPKEDDEYSYIEGIKKKISLNIWDVKDIIKFYLKYMTFYKTVFPDLASYIVKTTQLLQKASNDLESYIKLVLPDLEKNILYPFPNAWFITPGGFLYNTGGKEGHKEGKLIYAYQNICNSFSAKEQYRHLTPIIEEEPETNPHLTRKEKIKKILNQGYVDFYEFLNYSNLMYQTISTPLVDDQPEVSYQKNIITLVVGYLSALDAFNNAYERLKKSNKTRELIWKIAELTQGDLADILVRFAGFSKVESQKERTITTSALNGIDLFQKYLDRGWELNIIPGIVYDEQQDEVSPVNFDSIFIQKYLEEKKKEYHGKGKVLIHSLHQK